MPLLQPSDKLNVELLRTHPPPQPPRTMDDVSTLISMGQYTDAQYAFHDVAERYFKRGISLVWNFLVSVVITLYININVGWDSVADNFHYYCMPTVIQFVYYFSTLISRTHFSFPLFFARVHIRLSVAGYWNNMLYGFIEDIDPERMGIGIRKRNSTSSAGGNPGTAGGRNEQAQGQNEDGHTDPFPGVPGSTDVLDGIETGGQSNRRRFKFGRKVVKKVKTLARKMPGVRRGRKRNQPQQNNTPVAGENLNPMATTAPASGTATGTTAGVGPESSTNNVNSRRDKRRELFRKLKRKIRFPKRRPWQRVVVQDDTGGVLLYQF